MRVLLSQIRPNPFRNIDRYPYNEAKIEALRESIRETGFWDNIVGRVKTGHDGMVIVEIAYGHHRMEAMRREYPQGNIDVEVPVRDLTDGAMLQIMARENMQEWGTNAWIEIETVRAIVNAYARGNVQLPAPGPDVRHSVIRAAPSFAIGDDRDSYPERPYTASTLAPFIGWTVDKVKDTLAALELIEAGILDDSDYATLSTSQALAMTTRAQQIREGARQRAREAETQSAAATEQAEEARREEEKAKREQDEQRRLAAEARDRQLAESAREAEESARVSYERARQIRESAEASARARQAEADELRKQGSVQASESARDAASQMRGGASVRDVMRQQPAHHANGQHHPGLNEKCLEAAAVLQRILTDSDISKLLTMLDADLSQASTETIAVLERSLLDLSTTATSWASRLNYQAKAVEPDLESAGI